MGLISVIVAAACLVAQVTLLSAHDVNTERILADRQAEADTRVKKLEDDYRRIMKEMGFNVHILPAETDGDEFRRADRTMPEEYVTRLANSRTMTVRHLLPILAQSVVWPEAGRSIYLAGTRGEVPLVHRNPKKPIQQAVPPGKAVLGYDLWTSLGLKVGDEITLLGRQFTVSKCQIEWEPVDDKTIWVDLATAQEMLDKQGRINGIQALKCRCPGMELSEFRAELEKILPGTRVKILGNKVLARAEARDRARREAVESLAAERDGRLRLRIAREQFAAYLIPLVIVACAAWVALLAMSNVRQRRGEIGILRAIGLRGRQVLAVFLGKAMLTGLIGAVLGYAIGLAVGLAVSAGLGEVGQGVSVGAAFHPIMLIGIVVAAPLLTMAASWAPAMTAARQDPADVLSEE